MKLALQNRVDPFGIIHDVPLRGALMGNRGMIHDAGTRTLLRRRWTSKAWIICVCSFKERRRTLMAPGTYTELFFLDEATALAAGHRPCFECRHAPASAFSTAFATGRCRESIAAPEMDRILHSQRLAAGNDPAALKPDAIEAQPDGTMIALDGRPFLIRSGCPLPWSFAGYGAPWSIDALGNGHLTLVTPQATIAALAAGYRPSIDISAAA